MSGNTAEHHSPRAKLQFDGTVTAGNVLTAAAMVFALVVWGLRLEGRVETERVERMRFETETLRRQEAELRRETEQYSQMQAGLRRVEDLLLTNAARQHLNNQQRQ
jgi:hypothetical protein